MNINNGGIFGTSTNPAIITPSTGTGKTVDDAGSINRLVYKATVTYAAYSAGATHGHATICTLPAKTKLVSCYADTTITYEGGSTTTAALVVGIADAGAEIIATHDVHTAAILVGLADADMGTGLTRAAAIQGGYLPSWTAATTTIATLACSHNTSTLTQGSTTFYLVTEQYL